MAVEEIFSSSFLFVCPVRHAFGGGYSSNDCWGLLVFEERVVGGAGGERRVLKIFVLISFVVV